MDLLRAHLYWTTSQATTLVASLVIIFFAPTTIAQVDVTGSFRGTVSIVNFNCDDPSENFVTDTGTVTVEIPSQNGGTFSGSAIASGSGDGGDASLSINGIVDANGAISGSFSFSDDDGSGTAAITGGAIVGDVLTFAFSGSDTSPPGDLCDFSGAISAIRAGGGTTVPEIAAISEVVTATQVASAVRSLGSTLSTRVSGFLRRSGGGVPGGNQGVRQISNGVMLDNGGAAGDPFSAPVGVWASFSATDAENTFQSTAFEENRLNAFVGFDVQPIADVVVGVAFGVESVQTETRFNNGNQSNKGYTIAPYAGWLINDNFSVDLSLGHSRIAIDQDRQAPGTTAIVASQLDATRWFVAANANFSMTEGAFAFSGRAGGLWAKQRNEGFQESDGTALTSSRFELGQAQVGAEVSYLGVVEPYLSGAMHYDFSKTRTNFAAGVASPSDDRSEFLLGIGLRYFNQDGLSVSGEYSKILDRDDYSEGTFNVNVRYDF